MLEAPSTPITHEANIGVYPWSVIIGTPCEDKRLIENPHVKNEPPSCQNASDCIASIAPTRFVAPAIVAAGSGAPPSTPRPIDSGESRITQSESGSMTTSTPAPISMYVWRQPVARMSHVTSGTSRLIPVIDALATTESAVPRRLLNQRATVPDATTGPVSASPNESSTP